jgi:oligopeptide transport system substrate-binding protein
MKDFRSLLFALTLVTLLTACGGETAVVEDTIDPTKIEKIEGGKFKGGVLRLNSIEDYTSLFPVAINDIYSTHIAGQCYEGLFKFNQKTLEAEPCLSRKF